MAGNAVTNKFSLGAATVMIGPQANLFDLNPAAHSVGLVKNFTLNSTPTSVDLTQGIRNSVIMSIVNGGDVNATMEVYEYTARMLAYGLGLDASGGAYTIASPIATTLNGVVTGPIATVTVTSATGLLAGDYIMINDITGGADDLVTVRKILSISTNVLTLTTSIAGNIANGSAVTKVNNVPIGNPTDGLFLGAKVVGRLADGSTAHLLFPKIRIVKGFSMSFKTDSFDNLPFEFKLLDLATTDTNFAAFGANVRGQIHVAV